MRKSLVYIGLGGNIGDSASIVEYAAVQIASCRDFFDFRRSSLYVTPPVSPIPQNDYTNAVCSFETYSSPWEVLRKLQKIEAELGKIPKPKTAPRIIDLDILIFGDFLINEPKLTIPHPHWLERFFVLIPLADLTDSVFIPHSSGGFWVDIHQQIKNVRYHYAESSC